MRFVDSVGPPAGQSDAVAGPSRRLARGNLDRARLVVGGTLEQCVRALRPDATPDVLTGVDERAGFDREHTELLVFFGPSHEPLCLVLAGVDGSVVADETFRDSSRSLATPIMMIYCDSSVGKTLSAASHPLRTH